MSFLLADGILPVSRDLNSFDKRCSNAAIRLYSYDLSSGLAWDLCVSTTQKKNPSGTTPEEQSTKVPYKFCKASKELAHCIGIDFKIGMFVGKQDRRWQRCTLKYLIFMTDVTCQKVLVLSGLVPRLSLSGGISLLGYVTFVIYGLNLMHWLACLEGLKHLLHRQILYSKLLCFLY